MGRLVDRINKTLAPQSERDSIDTWITDYLMPANNFQFGGHTYGFGSGSFTGSGPGINTTWGNAQKVKEVANSLSSYSQAVKRCPPAFAAEVVRAMVLSQARFTFRNKRSVNSKKKTFGTSELAILEEPWVGGTTGDLISRMEWHAGLAGNAYVTRQNPLPTKINPHPQPRLRILRPDWVAMIYGSDLEPDDPCLAIDAELLGYVYVNGGFTKAGAKATLIFPEDMAHWFPLPDPEAANLGMSWITPAIREMQTDGAATEHKLMFFTNAATPNMVIKNLPGANGTVFNDAVDMLEARHTGIANAYKTLYLAGGADATVVGSTFQQMEFKDIIGAGETRITALSRVPAIMIGLSEGLEGAALNAGNFGQVRRMFADTWVFPELQNLAASLAPLINVPSDSELWFDVMDMPILREDAMDQASIVQLQASTIGQLVRDGFTPESATLSVMTGDMTQLIPIPGWISVQLQAKSNPDPPVDNSPKPVPKPPSGK